MSVVAAGVFGAVLVLWWGSPMSPLLVLAVLVAVYGAALVLWWRDRP